MRLRHWLALLRACDPQAWLGLALLLLLLYAVLPI
jgi:hypothetical protein